MNPLETLELSSSATQEDIRLAFKRLAMKHHPDRGGDPEKFEQIKQAYELLKSRRKCPLCDGKGYVQTRRGFFVDKHNCPRCWGLKNN